MLRTKRTDDFAVAKIMGSKKLMGEEVCVSLVHDRVVHSTRLSVPSSVDRCCPHLSTLVPPAL